MATKFTSPPNVFSMMFWKHDQRWWWIALSIILVVAGGLRLTGYNFSYPYLDHIDEPALNIAADMILHIGTAAPQNSFDTYPPGSITLYYLLLRWLHDPETLPGSTIPIMRIISVIFSLGSITIVAMLGRRIATPISGLLAAGQMAIFERLVEYNRWGTADSFVTFFSLLAVYLAVNNMLNLDHRRSILSIFTLCIAILFKYQAIFITPAIFLPMGWRLIRAPTEERLQVWRIVFDVCGIFAAFLFWLLAIYPALEVNRIGEFAAVSNGMATMSPFNLVSNFTGNYLTYAASPIWAVVMICGLAGLLFLIHSEMRHQVQGGALILLFFATIIWHTGVSLFGTQDLRQLLFVQSLVVLFASIGWTLIASWLADILKKRSIEFEGNMEQVAGLLLSFVLLLANVPELQASIENARQHTLPDRRVDLMAYADTSLDAGLYVADRPYHKVFDPFWGGYTGTTLFQLFKLLVVSNSYQGMTIFETADIVDLQLLKEWRDNKVLYAILSSDVYQSMQENTESRSSFEQMVLLKSYPASPNYRDPGAVVFRIFPMQHKAEGQLGPIHLLGYDIDTTRIKAGESFTIRYYFQADQTPDADYFVFNHLVTEGDIQPVAQFDGPPLLRRSTMLWDDPAEIIYSRAYTIPVGADVAPGVYQLLMGFYRLDTGERLLSPESESVLKVITIRISKP